MLRNFSKIPHVSGNVARYTIIGNELRMKISMPRCLKYQNKIIIPTGKLVLGIRTYSSQLPRSNNIQDFYEHAVLGFGTIIKRSRMFYAVDKELELYKGKLDREFDEIEFTQGCGLAIETVKGLLSNHQLEDLEPLMTPTCYSSIKKFLTGMTEKKGNYHLEFDSYKNVEIVCIFVGNNDEKKGSSDIWSGFSTTKKLGLQTAITVKFSVLEKFWITGASGNIIFGNSEDFEEKVETWEFLRNGEGPWKINSLDVR